MKTPVLESLFNKVAGMKILQHRYYFENTYPEKHLRTAASDFTMKVYTLHFINCGSHKF